MKVAAAALACLVTVAAVADACSGEEEEKIGDLAEAVFSHMAGTYMCRNALGGMAHYQAARTIAVGALTPYVGNDQAVLYVDQMDKKFRSDPRAKNPKLDDAACLETINDTLYKIKVAKAKLGK
ncbi:hypothetical protein AB4144_37735 [Rhizobiaceae sp. 2RAB30]